MAFGAGGLGLIGAGVDLTGGLISDIFGYNSAKQQENYQTYMSDTAYQRAVTSMKAAGLNPILAAGGSAASTPSGTQFTPANPAKGAASNAIDIANATQQLSNMSKQGDLLDNQITDANNKAHASAVDAAIADSIVGGGVIADKGSPGSFDINRYKGLTPVDQLARVKVDSAISGAQQASLNAKTTTAELTEKQAISNLYQALPQASWLREFLPILQLIFRR